MDLKRTHQADSWIELDASAFARNVEIFRSLAERSRLFCVLKANAYGHGLRETAGILAPLADGLAVFNIDEAITLRFSYPDIPVLVLGPAHEHRIEEASRRSLELTASSMDQVAVMAEKNCPIRVHLKLETGTNRQGIREEHLETIANTISRSPHITAAGVYTHFANIEDTTDHTFAMQQLQRFEDMTGKLADLGIKPACRHTACSAAALLFPESLYDMCRIGISMYGLWPSPQTRVSFTHRYPDREVPSLKPVLTWKARLTQVRKVKEGDYIGYGLSYRATRDLRIGVLGVGYSDGYDRRLSNQAFVLIRGKRAPVRGKICMNMTMIDLTDIPDARSGDTAVLLGNQNGDSITAETLAGMVDTINYEIVARIGSHLPRIPV